MRIVGPFRLALLALAALSGAAPPAWAIIDYGNGTTGTRVFTLPAPTVANYEGTWGSFLGTPIGSYYFISAKHINGAFGAGVGQTFTINSQNFTVSAQYDSPSSDLTVWEVNPNSTAFSSGNIAPLYPLYNQISSGYELNKSMVLTGRGTDVGAQVLVGSNLRGWKWGNSDGLQSWGTNTVSLVGSAPGLGFLLQYNFDASGGSNEGTLSVGDSGGGVFIQDPNDSTWKLAGINYGVESTFSLSADGSNYFSAAIFNRSGLYEYESGSWVAETGPAPAYSTRVASNLTFINSITGSPIWKGAAGNSNWSTASNWSSTPANGNNLVFSGSSQTANTNNTLTSVGAITFDGAAGAFSLSGNALTIAGGVTNFSANTETIGLNLTLSASQSFSAVLGNLTVNGTIATGGNALTVTGTSNTALAGAVSGTGGLVKSGAGTLTVSANNTFSGGTTVSAGILTVGHVHGLGSGGLAITDTAKTTLQANLNGPVQLPSLTIAGGTSPTATLDITNDNLIVHNGNLATLTAQVKSGLNISGTLWTGAGITSSTAAADASGLTAVGIIPNNIGGNPLYSTWPVGADSGGAVSVTTTDDLLKFTYFGDADLNGVVDNDTDLTLWSNGFTSNGALTGWLWGDFDYNGTVNNDTDLTLWSLAFTGQGAPLVAGGVQPVPEPSTLVLAALGLGGIGAMHRRRRNTQA